MWLNHHAMRSKGGRTNFTMSNPVVTTPPIPNTMATGASLTQRGLGFRMPSVMISPRSTSTTV